MVSSMVPITIGRHVVVDANHDHHRQHQHQHHRDRHADIDVDDDRWLLAIRGSRVVVAGGITSRYAFPFKRAGRRSLIIAVLLAKAARAIKKLAASPPRAFPIR